MNYRLLFNHIIQFFKLCVIGVLFYSCEPIANHFDEVEDAGYSLLIVRACLIIRFCAHSGSIRGVPCDYLALQERKLGKSLFNNYGLSGNRLE